MNYFDQMAERQLTGAQKARERQVVRTEQRRLEKAMRMPSPLEKKQAEAAQLLKLYRAWRRELKAEIVRRHGRDFAELLRLLRNLHWHDAEKIVDFVDEAEWLRTADADTRLSTLSYIDESLIRARVRYALSPFDDGIPMLDEEPGPGTKCRMILFGY